MEFLQELDRIRVNITESLEHVSQCKNISKGNESAEDHFLLIEQIFENHLHIIHRAEHLAGDSLPFAQLNYVSIWLDIHFWITKLGYCCERISLMIAKSSKLSDFLGEQFRLQTNSIIGLSIIYARFLETAVGTEPPLSWIRDEQLMRTLVEKVKNDYIALFSTLEAMIVSCYHELLEKDEISPVQTDITELFEMCESFRGDPNFAAVYKKLEKMAANEHPQFARIIRHITDIYLSSETRKIQLSHWLFFLHARNSLLHKKGLGTTDCEMELWCRSYKIMRGQPFDLYKDASFPILCFRLIELFFDLALTVIKETSLVSEWENIKKCYLDITVRCKKI